MDIKFRKLIEPTAEIAESFTKWENDPNLIPFIRPNKDKEALETREIVSVDELEQRLEHHQIYLIYLENQLVGEMDYQVDPKHLFKNEPGTAWIGIIIGEESARGKRIGYLALQYLEEQVKLHGLKRIELGVFEFNQQAIRLYERLGYNEIARIEEYSYWQDKMWQDIRMEKHFSTPDNQNKNETQSST
jgi:RimJ/RimL family protein N-acetyltransferase